MYALDLGTAGEGLRFRASGVQSSTQANVTLYHGG
jgi:hypothetical protein